MDGMSTVKILEILNQNTPVILLVGILLYLNALTQTLKHTTDNFNKSIKDVVATVDEIKKRITWSDTCGALHAEVNRRLDRVETHTGMPPT